jgi:hypothetical protein
MTAPWVWHCEHCDQYVPADAIGEHHGGWWHFDILRRDWCGPAERVEVQ